jgi:Cdc6-like AAA superfamily ATPase
MITNNVAYFDRLEDRAKSRLGSRKILFEPYNANMIRDILLKRAEVAFRKDVLEPTVIPKIAALSAQYHGDVPKAIGLLKHCGERAEERNTPVKESYIDIADEMKEEKLLRGTIKSFPLQVKVLLEALVLAWSKKEHLMSACLSFTRSMPKWRPASAWGLRLSATKEWPITSGSLVTQVLRIQR